MAMIMSVAVCYGSRLIERDEFEAQVSGQFTTPFQLPDGVETYRAMLKRLVKSFIYFNCSVVTSIIKNNQRHQIN